MARDESRANESSPRAHRHDAAVWGHVCCVRPPSTPCSRQRPSEATQLARLAAYSNLGNLARARGDYDQADHALAHLALLSTGRWALDTAARAAALFDGVDTGTAAGARHPAPDVPSR
jgi:hypothetical protein